MTAAVIALNAHASAFAQPATAAAGGAVSSSAPIPADIAAFYATYQPRPIWVRGAVDEAAVSQLRAILQRAPFDGFAEGPQLAAQVQAAVAQARTADPAAMTAAERTLSAAWVRYVQALKRPTPGMTYTYPVLKPQGTRAEEILLTAAASPSLKVHLAATSNVNSIYGQIRDAAWADAQASANLTPDPRLVANLDRLRS